MEEKAARWHALGAMSGTSLDGVDAAVIETDGERVFAFGRTGYRAYTPQERAVLRDALGTWPGAGPAEAAARIVEQAHLDLLATLPGDVVGLHGQTLAHAPGGRGTHQAGDGARLAAGLGRPVVWDFRSADVAAGGQGAPFASAFHFALARHIGAREPLGILNLGGVGNLTWIDPSAAGPFAPGAMLAFDTGPANAPLDDLVATRLGAGFDRDGALAAAGQAEGGVIARFLQDPFFARRPPKSLDRMDFPSLPAEVAALGDADAAATLVEAAAQAVARGLDWCPRPPAQVLVTGGGRKNPALMERLCALLPCPVAPVETHGLDGDMIEAQAFAFLAVRVLRGLPLSGPGTTGVAAPLCGGRVDPPPRQQGRASA